MDERVRALLEKVPEKPPRSKLEPHLEVIRELRRKGRTLSGNRPVLWRARERDGGRQHDPCLRPGAGAAPETTVAD